MSDTAARVIKILAKQLSIQEDTITLESKIVEDLGADSLDTVELVVALEEEFETKVPDDDSANLHTVGDVVAFIEERIQPKA